MPDRYFLYLDILGFSDLVMEKSGRITDLYEVVTSLNANDHDVFKVIVFSDTVLVYNVIGGQTPRDARYLIMYLCEFAKDLLHRLTRKGIFFRAVITHGDFTHYELNGTPCFFGDALVDAYRSEKQLKAIGLFIRKNISQFCDIFKFRPYNQDYNFVYMTQSLHEIEEWGRNGFPIPSLLIEDTDAKWHIWPELDHVMNMYAGSMDRSLPKGVQKKYLASWKMYCREYRHLTNHLANSGRDITTISPDVGWDVVMDRYPEDYSWAVKTKKEF